MVRKGRLEPSRVTPLDPKSSASTNSATFAVRREIITADSMSANCLNDLVGREGIEPPTNGFSYSAVSDRTGLSHHPHGVPGALGGLCS